LATLRLRNGPSSSIESPSYFDLKKSRRVER
jgi:hypothetical protein